MTSGRIERHGLHARVALGTIAEPIGPGPRAIRRASAPMRIGRGDVEEERPRITGADERARAFGYVHGIALVSAEHLVEAVRVSGRDVELADARRAVARLLQQHGQRTQVRVALEVAVVVLVPVLRRAVVVQARQQHRPTGAAARRRRVRVREAQALGCERVEVRCPDGGVAVRAGVLPVVVGDEHDDVQARRGCRRRARRLLREATLAPGDEAEPEASRQRSAASRTHECPEAISSGQGTVSPAP